MILDNITLSYRSKNIIMSLTSSILVLSLVAIAAVFAAPLTDQSHETIPILKQSQDGPNPDGSYAWSYETGNGIKADEEGSIERSANSNNDEGVTSVHGSYSYLGDDGRQYRVSYIADGDGFRPTGDHIPNPPEIPRSTLKALQWIADHPEEDNLRK